jgi:tetrahydromethanopterin S-methyltransferase subunit G
MMLKWQRQLLYCHLADIRDARHALDKDERAVRAAIAEVDRRIRQKEGGDDGLEASPEGL